MGKALPYRRALTLALALALALAGEAPADTNWTLRVRAVADFLLKQQTSHGCIPDVPSGLRANENGGMQYALLALAQAQRIAPHSRYRDGLRGGIEWLATTMERRDKTWLGSWRHAYSAKPPYVALPTSPGGEAEDARGSTATCALFAYLVFLQRQVTENENVTLRFRPYVRAALDFMLERNLADNHLFYSGWYRPRTGGRWELYRMQYAADQAAAYLGLRAGQRLLGLRRYGVAADRLARELDKLFDRRARAFGIALDPDGKLLPPADDCQSYLVQGYVAWVFGHGKETCDAVQWLKARRAPDGTFRRKRTDAPHILPAIVFCLGSRRCGLYPAERGQTLRWLRDRALTPQGAVRQVFLPNTPTPSHMAGWLTRACLAADPLPERVHDPGR